MTDEAFARFVDKTLVGDGCWEWQASTDRKGYGHMRVGGVLHKAHRLSYEHFVGPIRSGLVMDHLCRNPPCVNPLHLEPVTYQVNALRGFGPSAQHARRVDCINGHPLIPTPWHRGRYCKICASNRTRAMRARRAAQRRD